MRGPLTGWSRSVSRRMRRVRAASGGLTDDVNTLCQRSMSGDVSGDVLSPSVSPASQRPPELL